MQGSFFFYQYYFCNYQIDYQPRRTFFLWMLCQYRAAADAIYWAVTAGFRISTGFYE